MKARITIRLKKDVLDPEGNAIMLALQHAGFAGFDNVRKGKIIELDIAQTNKAEAEKILQQACEKMLCNQVIETYQIEFTDEGNG
ncbi:MAG: phosphoribosylformylglycinamidine synthase subunit PurS [Alphaproteobacteria bacterium]|nr:phosphoribosylformylglycinamidine synthase subunit PurS [Alphaproteobacteria bacterium]